MKTEKEAAVSRKTDEMKTSMVASIEFAARAPLREEYVDADFVHSILGRVLAKSEDPGDEEDAGYIKASVVQFGEGMDHGIGTDRLGDGIEGNIAEYWELLFDLETGYWREEIQDEYEASACDLLIIDCVEIRPKWRGMGVGPATIDRKRSRLPPQPGSGHSQGSVGLSTEELGGTSCTVAVSSRRAVAAIERDTQCPAGEAPVSQQTWESQQRERHDREAGRSPGEVELWTVRYEARQQVRGRPVLPPLLPAQVPPHVCHRALASRGGHPDTSVLDGTPRHQVDHGLSERGPIERRFGKSERRISGGVCRLTVPILTLEIVQTVSAQSPPITNPPPLLSYDEVDDRRSRLAIMVKQQACLGQVKSPSAASCASAIPQPASGRIAPPCLCESKE